MNLSQARWILLGSSAVVLPRKSPPLPLPETDGSVSFFGGIAIKEYFQAEDLRAAVRDVTPTADEELARKRAAALRLERSAQARIAASVFMRLRLRC
jgi:hypothetical protein